MPPEANALPEPERRRPPSALTRDDWVRIYDEEFAAWMELTPAERWRESTRLWATFFLLGGRIDDDLTEDGLIDDDDTVWRLRRAEARCDSVHLRRRGVWRCEPPCVSHRKLPLERGQ